jgi:tetratricopeptide (TPR) repeat protein
MDSATSVAEHPGSATQHLVRAIRWDRNNAQAYRLLAQVYRDQGQWLDAVEMLTRYTELRPKNPLGYIELAELYGKIEIELASLTRFDLTAMLPEAEVRVADSTGPTTHVSQEPMAGLPGAQPGAVIWMPVPASVTFTLSLPPEPSLLVFNLALPLGTDDLPEGRVEFVVAVDGERVFSEILDRSQSPTGWQERSVSLERWAGRDVTLALTSLAVPSVDGAGGWAIWDQPQVVDARSAPLQAIDPGKQATRAWQRSGLTLEDLVGQGEALQETGEYEAAMQSYQQALQLAPGSSDPWYGMGQVYEDQEMWLKALESYERAAAAKSSDQVGTGSALYRMGAIYHLRMDPPQLDAARDAYRAALESDDFASNAEAAWAHARLGQVRYSMDQDVAGAESEMKTALQLAPDEEWLYVVLGDLYRGENRVREAQAMYESALELAPGFDAAQNRLDSLE